MRSVSVVLGVCVALCAAAGSVCAQPVAAVPSPPNALQFDVVSVHRNVIGDPADVGNRGNVNVPTGPEDTWRETAGEFRARNVCMRILISFAYKVTTSQTEIFRASLPDWVMTDGYDIEARTDRSDVTKDEMREMVKALLADRFHLKVRYDMRNMQVYAVELAKPGVLGPHLRLHPANEPCSNIAPPQHVDPGTDAATVPAAVPAGYPSGCGGFANMAPSVPGLRHEASRNMPMEKIVTAFTGLGNLGRPTTDRTGLQGEFDWFIEYKPDAADADPSVPGPSFEEALKNQLGLKLVSDKAPFEYVLVEHIERPTEN